MNIYVGNLAWGVDSEAVRKLFEAHGEVESCQVVTDRETGRSRGFAFVTMPDAAARQAIEAINGVDLQGRRLAVNEARPRTAGGGGDRGGFRRTGGGGGGGGGRSEGGRSDRSRRY